MIQEAPRERTKKTQAASTASTVHPLSGVVFDDVTPPLARQMDLPVNNGVVVTDIEEGSLAEASGLQPGDVVLELNRQYVNSFAIFQRLADPLKPTDLALLLVNRQGNIMYIPIQGSRERGCLAGGQRPWDLKPRQGQRLQAPIVTHRFVLNHLQRSQRQGRTDHTDRTI